MSDPETTRRRKPVPAEPEPAPEATDADQADATYQECIDQLRDEEEYKRSVLKRKTDMLDTIANFLHQTREGWQSTDEVAAARAAAANLAAEMFAQHQVER